MITETAKYRIRVIAHWQKYGLSSTIDTFGVKRRTLFNWKHLLKEDRWKYEALNLGDRTPTRPSVNAYGHWIPLNALFMV